MTEYDCDPALLASLRDAVAQQIETAQRQMNRLLTSAVDPNAPDDYDAIAAIAGMNGIDKHKSGSPGSSLGRIDSRCKSAAALRILYGFRRAA